MDMSILPDSNGVVVEPARTLKESEICCAKITMDNVRIIAGAEFKNISDEEWRVYVYPNGGQVHIQSPQWLHIKRQTESLHSHRIVDRKGTSWYIPSGWVAINWQSPAGKEFKFI